MEERALSETDLQAMLEDAVDFDLSVVSGRFLIRAVRQSEPWRVVVEPDEREHRLVIVTAYRVE